MHESTLTSPGTSLQPIIDFMLEIDRLKLVTRKIRVRNSERYENSAEHSWQLVLFALSLQPHAPVLLDIDRVMRMLLIHDLGEIDVGDTLAFVETGWEQRKHDEHAAVCRILRTLPPGQADGLIALWEEFEHGESAEARFANAIDRAMPVLLNLANEGQSWRENHISHERVVRRVQPPIEAGCPALWAYLEPRLREANANGWFG